MRTSGRNTTWGRLSQKLGLFRLVQVPGSHELCFSNPKLLAQAIMVAGGD
jgi:hypothetical protein